MKFTLKVVEIDKSYSLEVDLSSGSFEIGRKAKDLCIDDPKCSRRHAQLSLKDGKICLEDLGSTNGTFLIDEAITEEVDMTAGGQFRIGATHFFILVEGDDKTMATAIDQVERMKKRPFIAKNHRQANTLKVDENTGESESPPSTTPDKDDDQNEWEEDDEEILNPSDSIELFNPNLNSVINYYSTLIGSPLNFFDRVDIEIPIKKSLTYILVIMLIPSVLFSLLSVFFFGVLGTLFSIALNMLILFVSFFVFSKVMNVIGALGELRHHLAFYAHTVAAFIPLYLLLFIPIIGALILILLALPIMIFVLYKFKERFKAPLVPFIIGLVIVFITSMVISILGGMVQSLITPKPETNWQEAIQGQGEDMVRKLLE